MAHSLEKIMQSMDMVSWCAGMKATITDYYAKEFTIEKCITEYQKKYHNCVVKPVIVCSVNSDEQKAIARLKELGFKRGPTMKNWGHGGRKTWLYFYQIPKRQWTKITGNKYDWNE
jgi:hypothetical protein